MNLRTPVLTSFLLLFTASCDTTEDSVQPRVLESLQQFEDPPPKLPLVVASPSSEETIRLNDFSMDISSAARGYLDRAPIGFRDDCSGFASAALTRAGIPADGTVSQFWELADERNLVHYHPIPTIGDLAFFDNTHDRNENGRWDDVRTHIAVVIDVEPDGTIVLAHNGSFRATLSMNLLHPHQHEAANGRELNGFLRRYGANDTWSLYLAGQLWSGFATVDPSYDWVYNGIAR